MRITGDQKPAAKPASRVQLPPAASRASIRGSLPFNPLRATAPAAAGAEVEDSDSDEEQWRLLKASAGKLPPGQPAAARQFSGSAAAAAAAATKRQLRRLSQMSSQASAFTQNPAVDQSDSDEEQWQRIKASALSGALNGGGMVSSCPA